MTTIRRCVAWASSRKRRCEAGAMDGFDTCIVHTSKTTLIARLRAAEAR